MTDVIALLLHVLLLLLLLLHGSVGSHPEFNLFILTMRTVYEMRKILNNDDDQFLSIPGSPRSLLSGARTILRIDSRRTTTKSYYLL